jgi:chorismate mutase
VNDPLADLRGQITANDVQIVAAVNERLRLVDELWEVKRAVGAEQVDPDRERRLRDELRHANAGPLSDVGLETLMTALLELTKSELAR